MQGNNMSNPKHSASEYSDEINKQHKIPKYKKLFFYARTKSKIQKIQHTKSANQTNARTTTADRSADLVLHCFGLGLKTQQSFDYTTLFDLTVRCRRRLGKIIC